MRDLTADAENYPAPGYLTNLAERYGRGGAERAAPEITIWMPKSNGEIVSFADGAAPPLRLRGFEASDRLFPTLEFGIAPPVQEADWKFASVCVKWTSKHRSSC